MKKRLRGFLANTIFTSAFMILLGVLFIIFSHEFDRVMRLVLFSALLVMGGGQFIFFLRSDKKTATESRDLVNGLALFLTAFFVYFRWDHINLFFQYLFAFLIAFGGLRMLQSTISLRFLKSSQWYVMLAAAVIATGYGVVLMFIPFDGESSLLFTLLGSGFIFSGVFDIISSVWISVLLRSKTLDERLDEKNERNGRNGSDVEVGS